MQLSNLGNSFGKSLRSVGDRFRKDAKEFNTTSGLLVVGTTGTGIVVGKSNSAGGGGKGKNG